MKFIRFVIGVYLFFQYANTAALELRYEGVDCSATNRPPLQSRIIVTDRIVTGAIGDFFIVKVEGGLPSSDRTDVSCVDALFRTSGYSAPLHLEGYALYSSPFLYVFVQTIKSDSPKVISFTKRIFVYAMTGGNSFTLLREEWLGDFPSGIQSGLMLYDQPGQEVKYTLFE